MAQLRIDARHFAEVVRLVEKEGLTPEMAAAKVGAATVRKKRSRKPVQPKELGREMTNDDYHRMLSEEMFQAQVEKLAEGYGWYVFHDRDSRKNKAGFPDVFCAHPEHGIIHIELKTEDGPVRPAQKRVINIIRRAGGRAFIARPRHRDRLEALFAGRPVRDQEFELPEMDHPYS